MKIGAYNPHTGNILSEDITGINFGNVQKGKHSIIPVLIRPQIEEETIVGLSLYLQNNGGFNKTEFGYYTNSEFVHVKSYDPNVEQNTSDYYISDHFTVVTNPPDITGGVPLNVNESGFADYVWLDVNPNSLETGGTETINYRFIFEYS